ncbi:hypothetical protein BDQ12DRAFT_689561 [Crucibulum laeve]|uniref:Uncharacterized protein n=1 Tax=Crucibulum laeve TaxID=68775 RepID=A0A5C3LP72_9AGAR|nr:hypothetical protein BDQ12DRAFT_689561 [Crucibulum laeve]
MSNNSYYFRRSTIGRAASPPTWACYEQIPCANDDSYSDSGSDSCSEDDEDYRREVQACDHDSDSDENEHTSSPTRPVDGSDDIDMDMDEEGDAAARKVADAQRDVKGKQRAVEPESEPKRRTRRKKQQPVYTLRPILTIHRSQGFVWNQDLFVPPYIKDRYVASTSPPNARGFISSSVSSTNSALTDYEVEVVEIRIREGELDDIIP